MTDEGSGRLPRPEAVVQDDGGALVHVSTWGGEEGGLYTVPRTGIDTLYLWAVTTDWHQTGGVRVVGGQGLGGLEGWMHGWVRLEVPWQGLVKQIMIAVTWWVCTPPSHPLLVCVSECLSGHY